MVLEGSLVRVANLWWIVESTGCLGLLVRLPSTSSTHCHICTPTQNITAITCQAWDSGHPCPPKLEKQEIKFNWKPMVWRKSRQLCIIASLGTVMNIIMDYGRIRTCMWGHTLLINGTMCRVCL